MKIVFFANYTRDSIVYYDQKGEIKWKKETQGGPLYYFSIAFEILTKVLEAVHAPFKEQVLFLKPAQTEDAEFYLEYFPHKERELRCTRDPPFLDISVVQQMLTPKEKIVLVVSPILNEISLVDLIKLKDQYRVKIYLDVQGILRRKQKGGTIHLTAEIKDIALLEQIDVIKLSEYEEEYLGKEIQGPLQIITRGEKSVLIKLGEQIIEVVPPRVEVKDTTGCGDIFLAVFAVLEPITSEEKTRARIAAIIASYFASSVGEREERVTMTVERVLKERKEEIKELLKKATY